MEKQYKFGGTKSHSKTKHLITTKYAMHVTLRSSKAVKEKSFLSKGKTAKIRDAICSYYLILVDQNLQIYLF